MFYSKLEWYLCASRTWCDITLFIKGYCMKKLLIYLLMIISNIYSLSKKELQSLLKQSHPFSYDLGIKVMPGKQTNSGVTICCHGYGSSCQVGEVVHSFRAIPDHIVSFNFPDYDCIRRKMTVEQTVFGKPEEIMPVLYILKVLVIDGGVDQVSLYGFSAGGGAIINVLSFLNQTSHDLVFKKIGIDAEGKKKIIAALQKGIIILDCPLKSMDEIASLRPGKDMNILSKRYRDNAMRPIDAITYLKGLNVTILVHFQNPDEMIGNADDALFIERLKSNNAGKTYSVIANEGGHNTYHKSLWNEYTKIRKNSEL